MKKNRNFESVNQGKEIRTISKVIVFTVIGVWIVVSVLAFVIMGTVAKKYGIQITDRWEFFIIPFVVLGLPILSILRFVGQWKKDKEPTKRVACGRGPNRGVESLPAGMGRGEQFFIKKVMFELKMGNVFQLLNVEGNKIFEVNLDLSGFRKYTVKNNYGECVGTIQCTGGVTNLGEYEIQIGSEPSFTVRQLVHLDATYEVMGLDYMVKSDLLRAHYEILDLNGKSIAYMRGRQIDNMGVNSSENIVTMAPGVENNIYILFLMLTLYIDREKKRD